MHRLASRSALWLLLGFVLGGVAAPAWHAGQHAAAAHTDAPRDGLTVAPEDTDAFVCALCAVTHTPAATSGALVLHASLASHDIRLGDAPRSGSYACPTYDARGPPAC